MVVGKLVLGRGDSVGENNRVVEQQSRHLANTLTGDSDKV